MQTCLREAHVPSHGRDRSLQGRASHAPVHHELPAALRKLRSNVQGIKHPGSILQEEDPEMHAHVRKALQGFFSAGNIDAVVAQLTREVAFLCDLLERDAAAESEGASGVAAANAVDLAGELIEAVVRKVLFESSQTIDLGAFHDGMMQMAACTANPVLVPLVRRSLHPGFFRFRRNWHGMRKEWTKLVREVYSRPDDPESLAFWACLRRAFPDAQTDKKQWELALANGAGMCVSGHLRCACGRMHTVARIGLTWLHCMLHTSAKAACHLACCCSAAVCVRMCMRCLAIAPAVHAGTAQDPKRLQTRLPAH
jgi:hypothetical protein